MRSRIVYAALCLAFLAACGPAEVISTSPAETQTRIATPVPPSAEPARINTSIPASTPTKGEETVSSAPIQLKNNVQKFVSIAYAENSPFQKLDVYLPGDSEGPFPTFIGIHGGGFSSRSKAMYGLMGHHFAQNGYAFVAIDYRLSPQSSYPAHVEDSFCALAWVHANAETYGFDLNRLIVTGGSAGGYLASMVATVDDPTMYLQDCPNDLPTRDVVQAAVIFYGLYDFTNAAEDFPAHEVNGVLKNYWGAPLEDLTPERLAEMSPIAQINGSEPPFLILHGTADTNIPSWMSERFAEALAQAGVDVELVLIEGASHAFELTPLTGEEMALSLEKIEAFIERTFKP